jgi:hypothetical protein
VTDHDEPPSSNPPSGSSVPGFGGTFVTEDSILAGSLEFQGSRLIMWGGGNPLLAWGPGECLLERLTANRFVLSADGDTITFTADDPDGLDEMLSRHSFSPVESAASESSPLDPVVVEDREPDSDHASAGATRVELFPVPDPSPEPPEAPDSEPVQVAVSMQSATTPVDQATPEAPIRGRRPAIKAMRAERAGVSDRTADETLGDVETQDEEEATIADLALTRASKLKKVRPRRWLPNDLQSVAVKIGLVSGAIVVVMGFAFAILLILGGGGGSVEPEGELSPTTSIVTVPTTSPTTAPPPPADLETPVFALSGAGFAERWNVLAADLDETLLLSPNLSTPFSLVMTPYMTFDGILDSLGGSLRLRATPTGTTDGDRRILVAMALLIGTAEPSLTPDQRGQLVQELGLDFQDPDLGDIAGARTYNGLHYEMDYLEEEGVLQFTVRPESSVTTTTAAP